ncbi:hypothetical protein DH2020_029053 [Rehmannia glutinosa]|uniref:Uncharacterized protein n=1 Tax=Rehmannia glutinosa TaxID=99300 RepID=A0ABR0VSE6_REHGL
MAPPRRDLPNQGNLENLVANLTTIVQGLPTPELSGVLSVLGEVTYARAMSRARAINVNMNLDGNLRKAIEAPKRNGKALAGLATIAEAIGDCFMIEAHFRRRLPLSIMSVYQFDNTSLEVPITNDLCNVNREINQPIIDSISKPLRIMTHKASNPFVLIHLFVGVLIDGDLSIFNNKLCYSCNRKYNFDTVYRVYFVTLIACDMFSKEKVWNQNYFVPLTIWTIACDMFSKEKVWNQNYFVPLTIWTGITHPPMCGKSGFYPQSEVCEAPIDPRKVLRQARFDHRKRSNTTAQAETNHRCANTACSSRDSIALAANTSAPNANEAG